MVGRVTWSRPSKSLVDPAMLRSRGNPAPAVSSDDLSQAGSADLLDTSTTARAGRVDADFPCSTDDSDAVCDEPPGA